MMKDHGPVSQYHMSHKNPSDADGKGMSDTSKERETRNDQKWSNPHPVRLRQVGKGGKDHSSEKAKISSHTR